MNFRNRRTLLLGSIGLLVCGVVWRRARTQPVFAFRASNHAGTQTASLEFGGRAAKPSREGMPTFFISVADGNEDSFLDESLHDPHADALCGTDDKGPLPVQTPL